MYQNQNQFQSNNALQQCEQMIQQLITQTQQASHNYQMLLQQEQQNAQRLQELAQREQHASQVLQNALHGHQTAIQQLQQVSSLCRQIEQSAHHTAQMNQMNAIHANANPFGQSGAGGFRTM